jgi:16S rRNA U1498 N3-methylase RsmE
MGVNSFPGITGGFLLHEIALLSGEEWHHCAHVLRMSVGDALILFDGKGHGFAASSENLQSQEILN